MHVQALYMTRYTDHVCTYSTCQHVCMYQVHVRTKIDTEIDNLAPTAQPMSHFTTQYTLASVVCPLRWLTGCVAATPQPLEPPAPL